MTTKSKEKTLARELQARTGCAYTAALAAVRHQAMLEKARVGTPSDTSPIDVVLPKTEE